MTQEQFAARLGVSVANLRHWERGDRSPQRAGAGLAERDRQQPRGRSDSASVTSKPPPISMHLGAYLGAYLNLRKQKSLYCNGFRG